MLRLSFSCRGVGVFLLLLSVSPVFTRAEEARLRWTYINGRPHIGLTQLEERLGIRSYFDKRRGRILLEGQGRNAFFLPAGSYAVIEGRFQRLARPLVVEDGNYFLDGALLQSHLLPFVGSGDRELLKDELRLAFRRLDAAVCALDRPVKKIFLDPGHGGEDRGAVRQGTLEKNVVSDFAKVVAKELAALGFETMLSRAGDDFVALDLRPELAREWGADVFVSLHANTSPFPGARGTETYILSSDATDAEARKLALSENTYLKTAGGASGPETNLENILWDIGQTAYLQDSAYLAANVQTELYSGANAFFAAKGTTAKWKNRGVREAPFLVLSRAAMPAVLVELAYLSNSQDRDLLVSADFKTTLAKSLASGVKKFAEHCQGKSRIEE